MIYDCSSVQSCDSASRSYFHTLTFFQPPIFTKTLTNLTDLTDFTILQTPYKRAGCTGAPIFFRAPCTGCCIAAFRRGWKTVRRAAGRVSAERLHARAGMQELHVFYRFCLEKLKFLGQKKSPKICSPTRSRGQISFTAWNRVKWQEESGGAASPRCCVPTIPNPIQRDMSVD